MTVVKIVESAYTGFAFINLYFLMTPEQERFGPEETDAARVGRPTSEDIEGRVQSLLTWLEKGERNTRGIDDIETMAAGGDGGENVATTVRETYYPGWTDGDFAELLRRYLEAEEKIQREGP